MSGGVEDVLFFNLTAVGTGAGVRLKSERGRGGLVSNVTWDQLTLINVGEVVQITDNYDPGLPPTNATATPRFENISVTNVFSNKAAKGWLLDGLPESPIKGLVLVNVTVEGTSAKGLIVKCDYVDKPTAVCKGVSPSCPPCIV